MQPHDLSELISAKEIQQRIQTLGKEISEFYTQNQVENLVVVGLLKGSFMFVADLVRKLSLPVEVDFITASSYGSAMETSHDVKINKDLDGDIKNRHVLIVEDIIDTGYTLQKIQQILALRDPASLKICTLLDKPSRREVEIKVDWVGFTIPNEFVVGFGIDYAQFYRNLGFIGKVSLK